MVNHILRCTQPCCSWILAADEHGSRANTLDLLRRSTSPNDLLVHDRHKMEDCVARQHAVAYVAAHIGKGSIRIADRAFRGFVVVAANGVATGWSATPEDRPAA